MLPLSLLFPNAPTARSFSAPPDDDSTYILFILLLYQNKYPRFYHPFCPLKWGMPAEDPRASFLSKHILFQLFPVLYLKLFHGVRDVIFHRICRYI